MKQPEFADYVNLINNLFDRFIQEKGAELGWYSEKFTYNHKNMIVFMMLMQSRRISKFKTQWRWLECHPIQRQQLGFAQVPHRTTLSRRYKALYPVLQDLIAYIGQDAQVFDERFDQRHLYEDKSLFKAQGPVWHQSDRRVERVPAGLRHLDTDATWSKSGYHGWVYGYSLHLTCNQSGFPKLLQVETAAFSEKQAMESKETLILNDLQPETLAADNGYTQVMRIRRWAKAGVALLTPAAKWVNGRYAKAYHRFVQRPRMADLLKQRRTAIEPLFDLIAKIIGATANHKQLPLQRLSNVRTCIGLAVLSLQIAMLANSIWSLPTLRSISTIMGAFA